MRMDQVIMNVLLAREKVREFYARYDVYFNPVVKFLVALLALLMLRGNLGYMAQLNSIPVILVVSLLCSLLPKGGIVLFTGLFLLGHIYAVSLEAAGFFAMCVLIMFFTYYVFKPGDAILLVVVPLLFWMKLPYLVPLVIGLTGTALSAVPVSFGVVIYYTIQAVRQNVTTLTESEASSMLSRFQLMVNQVLLNHAMWVVILAFVITVILVNLIHRLSLPYSWSIAVGVGALAQLAFFLAGITAFNVSRASFPMVQLVIGIILSAILALLIQFFVFFVDYKRTEYVQFEDDDYYYYVKAIPKVTVTPMQREVKRFAVNQKGREQGLSETVDLGDEVRNRLKEEEEEKED